MKPSKSSFEGFVAAANITSHHYSWVPRLKATFAEQGVLDSCTHHHPTSPHATYFFTQILLIVSEEYSWATLSNSGPESGGPVRRKLLQEVAREVQDGVGLKFIIEVTTGRKAW